MSRINQLITFPQVKHFHARLCERYSLHSYESRKRSSICFGCYPGSPDWVQKLLKHKSLLVLIWAGSDSMYILNKKYTKIRQSIKNADHIKHIAISQYVSKDLKQAGIKHEFIPVTQVLDHMFNPVRLGTNVFYYDSHVPRKSNFYGTPIVKKVIKYFPGTKFVNGYSTGIGHIRYADMPNVYAKCLLGLRLTSHDGLPNTVVEMGLMGRKCVCNHELPNCIPWRNIDDVINAIISEQSKAGSMDEVEEVSSKMRKYIDISTDWLFEDYWSSK